MLAMAWTTLFTILQPPATSLENAYAAIRTLPARPRPLQTERRRSIRVRSAISASAIRKSWATLLAVYLAKGVLSPSSATPRRDYRWNWRIVRPTQMNKQPEPDYGSVILSQCEPAPVGTPQVRPVVGNYRPHQQAAISTQMQTVDCKAGYYNFLPQ